LGEAGMLKTLGRLFAPAVMIGLLFFETSRAVDDMMLYPEH
jgi:hypothetical protein